MIIRECRDEDIDRLFPMFRKFRLEQAEMTLEIFPEFRKYMKNDEEMKDALRRKLDKGLFLVAEDDRKLIGFAYGTIEGWDWDWYKEIKFGSLNQLYVDEAHRKRGIGQELVKRIENWMKSEGCLFSDLKVYTNNPADEFHERQGYKKNYLARRKSLSQHIQ